MTTGLLIRNAEVEGRPGLCVRIRDDRIAELGHDLMPRPTREAGEEEDIDAHGGALLPGLRDHHVHLLSLAKALDSIVCGPPDARSERELVDALRRADAESASQGASSWLRGIGYHESVAGALDRDQLDAWALRRPLRIQHRSGALWILCSSAIAALGLEAEAPGSLPGGVERDAGGRITGRLFRLDGWLRDRIRASAVAVSPTAPPAMPRLARVGQQLARFGVTGVCDATAGNGAAELEALTQAVVDATLPLDLLVMGCLSLPRSTHLRVERGAFKVMLDENDLPSPEALAREARLAHADGRGVAYHCVTRAELVMAAVVTKAAGPSPLDRIEHASIAPPELIELLSDLSFTVVTQPNFIAERGDAYEADVEPRDQPFLYRCRGFTDAGIALAGGTDAPFGAADPWAAMRAAVHRRSPTGRTLGPTERLTPERALALFTTPLARPGGPAVPIAAGGPADLCLLDRPWADAREDLSARHVAATLRAGRVTWRR